MATIYLAGGFHGREWQEEVIDRIDNVHDFIDWENPKSRSSKFENWSQKKRKYVTGEIFKFAKTYTQWDLQAIRKSDIVFVFISKDNPAIGSLVELGYAKGLGKTVITVIEFRGNNAKTKSKDRYFDFAREVSDVHFDNLEDGIEYLDSIL